jgi:hypothetical protein
VTSERSSAVQAQGQGPPAVAAWSRGTTDGTEVWSSAVRRGVGQGDRNSGAEKRRHGAGLRSRRPSQRGVAEPSSERRHHIRRDQLHVGIPSAFSPARTKRTRRRDDEAERGRRPRRRIPPPRPSTTPLREQQVESKTARGGRGKGDGRETRKWEEMKLPPSRGHHMV